MNMDLGYTIQTNTVSLDKFHAILYIILDRMFVSSYPN